MARLARLTLPGLPHYVVQRGNNLQPIFGDAQDRTRMHGLLREMARSFGLDIHAYALLPNQMHLLLTPEHADSLPQFMQAVGRSYVRSFNNRHGRSGTLWEGRYRSTVLEAPTWLLAAMVALEYLPVQAGLAGLPHEFAWSSAAHNAGVQHDGLVRPHALYWALADTPFAREAAYMRLLRDGVAPRAVQELQEAALKGWALGSPDFVGRLQQQTQRRMTRRSPGRPRACQQPPEGPDSAVVGDLAP